jgi:hypothetical protein
LPPWTAAGSSFLLVLLCKTSVSDFGTEAKITNQSLKAGQIIWTQQEFLESGIILKMSLNPLKQVKSFGQGVL